MSDNHGIHVYLRWGHDHMPQADILQLSKHEKYALPNHNNAWHADLCKVYEPVGDGVYQYICQCLNRAVTAIETSSNHSLSNCTRWFTVDVIVQCDRALTCSFFSEGWAHKCLPNLIIMTYHMGWRLLTTSSPPIKWVWNNITEN